MKKRIIPFILFLFLGIGLSAQIFCPSDVTVSCLSDLTPDECGMATVVSGNYHPSMIKYVDQNETNACNEGVVYRRFYLDIDYNNTYSENEPSCVQTITLTYTSLPLNIQFPSDKEYTCIDEVPVESPTWLHHPCDLVGYTYEDEVFEFEAGACLKIVRTYHVINWCVYDENQGAGLYTGIQIIKITDDNPPELSACDDQFFDVDGNCEAIVTLTNSATDIGNCPSGMLTWRVTVDLWADGTEDLVYGPNELPPFRLDPVANGEEVKVEIPEALGVSKHKIVWKVTDGCGNVKSCSNDFFVEDNKPPTPYCYSFTSAALDGTDGGEIVIPASFFSVDALDNCSNKEDIQLSFSTNVDDTEKVIKCGDTGFQFFRIYYTDKAGNQDFCEVFMLIFDNGSCFSKYVPEGEITKPDGSPISDAMAYLMEDNNIVAQIGSDEFGFFNFGEQDLMEHYYSEVKKEDSSMEGIDIEDFVLMRAALLGLENINYYQKVAGDINADQSFDIDDLYAFRNILLGQSSLDAQKSWSFIPKMYTLSANSNDLNMESTIPYTSYGEGFNYFGVKKGDLTGAVIETVEIETTDDIELSLVIVDGEIKILANESFTSDAIQIDISNGLVQKAELSDLENIRDINGVERFIDLKSSNDIAEGQELVKAVVNTDQISSIESIIHSTKIFANGKTQPSKIIWNIMDERDQKIDNEFESKINAYPIPLGNTLNIDGKDISAVTLMTLTGEIISSMKYDAENNVSLKINDNIPQGLYLLKVSSNGEENVVKIVK